MTIKDTIEGLERIENKYPFEKKLTLEDAKCIWEARKIIRAQEQVEGMLPEKKPEGIEHTEWGNMGFNQAISIATPILAKKILKIQELEKSEYQARANYGDLLSDFKQTEKELQSAKERINEV